MRKAWLSVVLSAITFAVSAQQTTDTFHIYFDLNVPALNESSKASIDSLVYNDRILPGTPILIVGYADHLGTEDHNKKLSEARADNVRNYLSSFAINKNDVKLCVGRGQINRKGYSNAEGYPPDRKVDIVTERPVKQHSKQSVVYTPTHSPQGPTVVPNFKNDITDIAIYTPGESYVLKNLYFLPERHTITTQSMPELEKLYTVLHDHPTLTIRIEGHVCCIRDYPDAMDIDDGSMSLSLNRARAVYDLLAAKGINTQRLKYAGYGHSKPVVRDEQTEEDANKNRRVEIRVISK